MRLPLTAQWELLPANGECAPAGEAAPGESGEPGGVRAADAPAFSLPGARELAADFADLIGETPEPCEAALEAPAPAGIPFALPALLPPDAGPGAILQRTVDFGALHGDHARLCFSMLTGSGEICLDGEPVARFEDGPLRLDVTKALRRARRMRLSLRFDADGGITGPLWLQVSRLSQLLSVCILPDAGAQTVRVRSKVLADRDGEYVLRCIFVTAPGENRKAETSFALKAGTAQSAEAVAAVPAPALFPGRQQALPCVRVQLWLGGPKPGVLCDEQTLSFAYGGRAPRFFLPLTVQESRALPRELASRLTALHVPCVQLPEASDPLLLELARRGIFSRVCAKGPQSERLARFGCAVPAEEEDAAALSLDDARLLAARDLCSMIACPPAARAPSDAAGLLRQATGLSIDPDAPHTGDVLAWLRTVVLRLRAEALRQGALCGALCLPGEWAEADCAAALETALAPLHLSAWPLYGAWWTQSRFSAALHAFIPDGEGDFTAEALLEGEEGEVLASMRSVCPPGGGRLGFFDAALPDAPCVLTLRTRLLRGQTVAEQSAFPVYVGERGPLERAF